MRSYQHLHLYFYILFYFTWMQKEWYLRSWLKNWWTRRATDDMGNGMYVREPCAAHIWHYTNCSRSVGICEIANMHWKLNCVKKNTWYILSYLNSKSKKEIINTHWPYLSMFIFVALIPNNVALREQSNQYGCRLQPITIRFLLLLIMASPKDIIT